MTSKLEKFRRKLDQKSRATLDETLKKLGCGDFFGLDLKKLEAEDNRYRIRRGRLRIKFSINKDRKVYNIEVDWRDDNTYR